jgi:hypothetical protein
MISLHFNGDIVEHPDTALNYKRRIALYDATGRCKYGRREIYCPAYMDYIKSRPDIKKMSDYPRCVLSGCQSDKLKLNPVKIHKPTARKRKLTTAPNLFITNMPVCPVVKELNRRANIKKQYEITNSTYRRIASAGHYLIRTSKNKTIFITLTFPKFKKPQTDDQLNQYFSKFMENLRQNYRCEGYVAVREHGETYGRTHYHIICSMPFTDYRHLNRVWCDTIKDICYMSANALQTTRKKSVIYDHAGALRYVCKYFSKVRRQKSDSRIVFISHNLTKKPVQFRCSPEAILSEYKNIYIRHYDWTTVFSTTDAKEFRRFAKNVLYPAFEQLTAGNSGMITYNNSP